MPMSLGGLLLPDSDLFYAIRSARGRAAIAIVEIAGSRSGGFLDKYFVAASGGDQQARSRSAQYGRLCAPGGQTLDDVVVVPCVGTDAFLVTIHGNPVIAQELESWLQREGGRPAPGPVPWWGAGVTGGVAEIAMAALSEARTEEGVRFLLAQAGRGPAARGLQAVVNRWSRESPSIGEIDRILARSTAARALLRPATVVLAGAPNAGKSTLFNALLERRRVVTDEAPGTTRDLIEESWFLAGFPLTLVDGAGLRVADDPVEREGVDRMRGALHTADLVVHLEWGGTVPAIEAAGQFTLRIRSRADQIHPDQRDDSPELWVSGRTGEGLDDLADAILTRLFGSPVAPEHEAAAFTLAQVATLARLRQAVMAGRSGMPMIQRLCGDLESG